MAPCAQLFRDNIGRLCLTGTYQHAKRTLLKFSRITNNITVVDEHRWRLLEQGLGGESFAAKQVRALPDIVFVRVADRDSMAAILTRMCSG
jgi:hypothetical protein